MTVLSGQRGLPVEVRCFLVAHVLTIVECNAPCYNYLWFYFRCLDFGGTSGGLKVVCERAHTRPKSGAYKRTISLTVTSDTQPNIFTRSLYFDTQLIRKHHTTCIYLLGH